MNSGMAGVWADYLWGCNSHASTDCGGKVIASLKADDTGDSCSQARPSRLTARSIGFVPRP
jgi:hypothetical protein